MVDRLLHWHVSGVCRNCRVTLSKMESAEPTTAERKVTHVEDVCDDTEVLLPMENLSLVSR